MKIKTIIIITICFFSIQFAHAQSGLINCGIQYFYDAAGNRILRMAIPCAPPNTGNNNPKILAVTKDSTGQNTDSTLAAFQIVMIAPNPTAGPFMVTCNQDLSNAHVTIVDLNGQTVWQSTINGRSIPLDISHLMAGAYTVTVTSNGSSTSKTLVKMH